MTLDEALRTLTHRCAHYPTALIRPDTCEKRLNLAKRKPVVLGHGPGWECLNCPGPLAIGEEPPLKKPSLPKHKGHETRVLKQRAFMCCKCGTTDPEKFSKGHSRKCNACLETYHRLKIAKRNAKRKVENRKRLVCTCGKMINEGDHANRLRVKMKLCGDCFKRLGVSRTVVDDDGRPVVMVRGR